MADSARRNVESNGNGNERKRFDFARFYVDMPMPNWKDGTVQQVLPFCINMLCTSKKYGKLFIVFGDGKLLFEFGRYVRRTIM